LPDPLHANRVWRTIQIILQNVFCFWLDYRVRGMEHLPPAGAMVLSNHQSFLDPLLLGLPLDRPISFVARHSLFRVPVIGWILRNTYVMPINREAAGTESIREAARRLKHGFLIGMFPEGTRSRDGQLGEFKPGFIAILRQARVPIVPAGIVGADRAMPRGAVLPRFGHVRVVYGEPIPLPEVERLSRRGCEAELLSLVRRRIEEAFHMAEAWRADSGGGPLSDSHGREPTAG
jgi:1-acyl-sn-glycerol-3-phosphate acyltransferase